MTLVAFPHKTVAAVSKSRLAGGVDREPGREARAAIVTEHLRASVRENGEMHGVRMFRKHLAAYIEAAPWPRPAADRRAARARLCRLETVRAIVDGLAEIWSADETRLAA